MSDFPSLFPSSPSWNSQFAAVVSSLLPISVHLSRLELILHVVCHNHTGQRNDSHTEKIVQFLPQLPPGFDSFLVTILKWTKSYETN